MVVYNTDIGSFTFYLNLIEAIEPTAMSLTRDNGQKPMTLFDLSLVKAMQYPHPVKLIFTAVIKILF